MLKIERIDGLRLETGVQYTPTPQGAAFAHIGEFMLFADAAQIENGVPLNRAKYGGKVPPRSGYAVNVAALNGNPAFSSTSAAQTQLAPVVADLPVSLNEWSVSFVARQSSEAATQRRDVIRSSQTADASGLVGLNLAFSANGTQFGYLRIGGNNWEGVLCSYTAATSFLDRTVHMLITFSVASGVQIFENGVLVASNAAEKRVISPPTGEYHINAGGSRGLLSELLINKRDVSRIPGGVESISKFYKEKYAIF